MPSTGTTGACSCRDLPPWELIVGAGGGFVFAVWVVNKLWQAHLAKDKREEDRSDRLEARLDRIVDALDAGLKKAEPK